MQFRDITNDKKTRYVLKQDEKCVFFMHNRSGDITFELAGPGAEARIFAVMTGTDSARRSLRIEEHHLAPDTVSSAVVRNVLDDNAALSYEGAVRIERGAVRSDAVQDIRSLLLSSGASVSAEPALEILENDVRCRHSATASPVNQEQLFFARSRGLSEQAARQILVDGFLDEVLHGMRRYSNEVPETLTFLA